MYSLCYCASVAFQLIYRQLVYLDLSLEVLQHNSSGYGHRKFRRGNHQHWHHPFIQDWKLIRLYSTTGRSGKGTSGAARPPHYNDERGSFLRVDFKVDCPWMSGPSA